MELDLEVAHSHGLGDGITTVGNGAVLKLGVPEVYGNVVLDGGEINVNGVNRFVGDLVNDAELNPGSSPGTLTVTGDFTQRPNGKLTMEIVSPLLSEIVYSQSSDQLAVEGTLTLDGELSVLALHGYSPSRFERFQLFDAKTVTGEFTAIDVPSLDDGLVWNLRNLYTRGELSVIPKEIGDSNLDGTFNSGDLVQVFVAALYETGRTADWSQGDWNQDDVFDSGDLVMAFQANTYSAAVVAVPEPNPGCQLFVAFIALLCKRSVKPSPSTSIIRKTANRWQ
jgi:hypothetical protein